MITKEDEESKRQLQIMKEQLEANQRAMADMEKSWEQRLSEARAMEAEQDKER